MMEVKEFSHDVLSTAVDFMYGKDVPEDFNNAKDLEGLLRMADQYLMADLKDAVGARIGEALTKENILETSKLAELFTALKLSEKCADFLIKHKDVVEDEELDELGGAVLGELGKKAMKEFKKSSWMSKLWGEKVDFKKREDFEADEDYKGYVMARVEPKMLVRCNQKSSWKSLSANLYQLMDVKVGDIGCIQSIEFSTVTVKWLNVADPQGEPHPQGQGRFEHLDLLTRPVKFNC